MSESQWSKQGATLSLQNACKEFGLSEKDIIAALKQGTMDYRINYAHGNPYYKLIRSEVQALATSLRGAKGAGDQERKHKLATIDKEIRALTRKLKALQKEKAELEAG